MKKVRIENYLADYKAACEKTGETPVDFDELRKVGVKEHIIAQIVLEAIILAENEGKEVPVDGNACRWVPYFWVNSPSGFAFCASDCAYDHANAGSGSRLSNHDRKSSDKLGEKYVELYKMVIV